MIQSGDMVRVVRSCCNKGDAEIGRIGMVIWVGTIGWPYILVGQNCGCFVNEVNVAHCTFNAPDYITPISFLKKIDPPDFSLPAPPVENLEPRVIHD